MCARIQTGKKINSALRLITISLTSLTIALVANLMRAGSDNWLWRGQILCELGDYAAKYHEWGFAEVCWRKVTKLDAGETNSKAKIRYGHLLEELGRITQAKQLYEQFTRLPMSAGDTHTYWRCVALNNLSEIYRKDGDLSECFRLLEQSIQLRQSASPRANLTIKARQQLIILLANFANANELRGNSSEAYALVEKAKGLNAELGAQGNDPAFLWTIGGILFSQKRFKEAEPIIELSLRQIKSRHLDLKKESAELLNDLGLISMDKEAYKRSEEFFLLALENERQSRGMLDSHTATVINNLGLLKWSERKLPEAKEYFKQAAQIDHQVLGDDAPDTIDTERNLDSVSRIMSGNRSK